MSPIVAYAAPSCLWRGLACSAGSWTTLDGTVGLFVKTTPLYQATLPPYILRALRMDWALFFWRGIFWTQTADTAHAPPGMTWRHAARRSAHPSRMVLLRAAARTFALAFCALLYS